MTTNKEPVVYFYLRWHTWQQTEPKTAQRALSSDRKSEACVQCFVLLRTCPRKWSVLKPTQSTKRNYNTQNASTKKKELGGVLYFRGYRVQQKDTRRNKKLYLQQKINQQTCLISNLHWKVSTLKEMWWGAPKISSHVDWWRFSAIESQSKKEGISWWFAILISMPILISIQSPKENYEAGRNDPIKRTKEISKTNTKNWCIWITQ